MQTPSLDRRTSSVKWQRGMRGLGGECGDDEKEKSGPSRGTRVVIVVGRMAEPCERVAWVR